jgi:fucose permease
MGTAEVAINVEGAAVENVTRRPFLAAMHGFFSLGATLGAVAGIVFTGLEMDVRIHLTAVGALSAGALVAALRWVPNGTGKTPAHAGSTGEEDAPGNRSVWNDRRLLLIGLVVAAMALTEGAATDWLPLIMVDGHGLDEALSSTVFAAFAATMAIGRFTGGRVVRWLGRAKVLRASAVLAAVGVGLVAAVDSWPVASAAVLLWALGVALGFPLALSAAGDSGSNAAARVSFAATLGYLAFLVAPPLLGFVGEHVGLRSALAIPFLTMCLVVLLASVTGEDAGRDREASLDPPTSGDRIRYAEADSETL